MTSVTYSSAAELLRLLGGNMELGVDGRMFAPVP
jgi:hypothetical protein